MGSKTDGYECDHLKSSCCNASIRFLVGSDGYTIEAWCETCGNYKVAGRIETLLALYVGDLEAVKKNRGYLPGWIKQ